MPGHRPERVAAMVHRELAERLRMDVQDSRVSPISITHVLMSRDLSRATVSYLPLGGGKPTTELAEGLMVAGRKMRGGIGRALKLRHAPEIVFVWDEKSEDVFRVMGVLDRLRRERGEEAVGSEEDHEEAGTERNSRLTPGTPGTAEGSSSESPAPAEDGRQKAIFGARDQTEVEE